MTNPALHSYFLYYVPICRYFQKYLLGIGKSSQTRMQRDTLYSESTQFFRFGFQNSHTPALSPSLYTPNCVHTHTRTKRGYYVRERCTKCDLSVRGCAGSAVSAVLSGELMFRLRGPALQCCTAATIYKYIYAYIYIGVRERQRESERE